MHDDISSFFISTTFLNLFKPNYVIIYKCDNNGILIKSF